jgi:calcineurin-like phosphoesterase family protein
MHSVLIKNYNATVPADGVCFFLGDVGISSTEKTKAVIEALNGTKVLVLGNHDKGVESMMNCGFDVVLYGAVIYLQGQRVTMSHCPLMGVPREPTDHFANPEYRGANWHGEHKNQRFSFIDEGQFHLHGHIHSSNLTKGTKEIIQGRQMDIGVPGNHYRPVPFAAIESWIMKTLKAGG